MRPGIHLPVSDEDKNCPDGVWHKRLPCPVTQDTNYTLYIISIQTISTDGLVVLLWSACACTQTSTHLSLRAELHVLHPLTIALELCQRLTLHPLMELHGLLQRLDPPLQVHLIADFRLVLGQRRRAQIRAQSYSRHCSVSRWLTTN